MSLVVSTDDYLSLWCVACGTNHTVSINSENGWQWNGDVDSPTITPSIKVTGVQWEPDSVFHKPTHTVAPGEQIVCHSFVTDGVWHYLADSTHILAGRTAALEPPPEDWIL